MSEPRLCSEECTFWHDHLCLVGSARLTPISGDECPCDYLRRAILLAQYGPPDEAAITWAAPDLRERQRLAQR